MKRDGSKKEGVTEMPFVHLQVHSGYSLLNSAASVEDLTAKAKELGYSAIARIITFLCDEHSDYITGTVIEATGGLNVINRHSL